MSEKKEKSFVLCSIKVSGHAAKVLFYVFVQVYANAVLLRLLNTRNGAIGGRRAVGEP